MKLRPFAFAFRGFPICSLLLLSALAPAAELDPKSIYHSGSRWTTQADRPLELRELAGSPVVVAMLYTSCQAACPMIISDLKKIESGLREGPRKKVRFVALSFDSVRDTPAQLKDAMQRHSLDASRWTFARSDEEGVRELAALLGVRYRKIGENDFDHSNVITILDPKGVVVHRQLGLRQDPSRSIQLLSELVEAKPR